MVMVLITVLPARLDSNLSVKPVSNAMVLVSTVMVLLPITAQLVVPTLTQHQLIIQRPKIPVFAMLVSTLNPIIH